MKRMFDLALATVAIAVLFPVMLLAGIAVLLSMGPPSLFRQERIGLHGQKIVLLKLRTMGAARESESDEARLTRLGRFLRATSIDELPQLFNVIRGDMSLVGPRPLLVEYLPLYSSRQARRHEVHPGITGWAQVNGRNALSWDEKFELDVWYVDNRSFWLDLKILGLTLIRIFQRHGISHPGAATAEPFRGSRK